MLTVGISKTKARFAELLDKVAQGESILITRRGAPAALLVPPETLHVDKREGLAEIKRYRMACKTGKVDIETLIAEDRP